MSKDKYKKSLEENHKTKLASALVEELKKLNNEKNFIDFIEKFSETMCVNKTIGNEEKNYGFKETTTSGNAVKSKKVKETEKLFDMIRLGLSNILDNLNRLNNNHIEVLIKYLDDAIKFNENRKALICQGNLKETFGKLKTKTEELWENERTKSR